jgi:hypothetical protein
METLPSLPREGDDLLSHRMEEIYESYLSSLVSVLKAHRLVSSFSRHSSAPSPWFLTSLFNDIN